MTQVKKTLRKMARIDLGAWELNDRSRAMSDKQVRQEILDVFQWDPRVEAAHIEVSVEHGVVTLTGAVRTDDERIAAEEAIRHVAGVRQLLERIEVREPAATAAWHGKPEVEVATD